MDVPGSGAWSTIGRTMTGRAAFGENERLRRELERISIENRQLTRELARVREAYDDLSESALIWIQMYRRQLDRANRAHPGSRQTAEESQDQTSDKRD
jgi:septation ring formation regulator EzrA